MENNYKTSNHTQDTPARTYIYNNNTFSRTVQSKFKRMSRRMSTSSSTTHTLTCPHDIWPGGSSCRSALPKDMFNAIAVCAGSACKQLQSTNMIACNGSARPDIYIYSVHKQTVSASVAVWNNCRVPCRGHAQGGVEMHVRRKAKATWSTYKLYFYSHAHNRRRNIPRIRYDQIYGKNSISSSLLSSFSSLLLLSLLLCWTAPLSGKHLGNIHCGIEWRRWWRGDADKFLSNMIKICFRYFSSVFNIYFVHSLPFVLYTSSSCESFPFIWRAMFNS